MVRMAVKGVIACYNLFFVGQTMERTKAGNAESPGTDLGTTEGRNPEKARGREREGNKTKR